MFKGCCTALITPFTKGNRVNFNEFKKIIEAQIRGGVSALLFLGTTGESPTLSEEEREEIVKLAVKEVAGRVPVLVGSGCNSTEKTIFTSQKYQRLGADGLLVVAPYYNKATQEGLYRHYKAVADSVDIPIMIYNVPGRTGINVSAETIVRLSKEKNIIGLKQASGDMGELMKIVSECDKDFSIYSGEDSLAYIMMSVGAKGVISVASNVFPDYMSQLCKSFFEGKKDESLALQLSINPFVDSLFSEVNPIPVKYAMNKIGYEVGIPRLPLTEMENKSKIDKKLDEKFIKNI